MYLVLTRELYRVVWYKNESAMAPEPLVARCGLSYGSDMVFVSPEVFLPLLTALTAFAAPVDDVDLNVSPAVDAVSLLDSVTTMTSAQVGAFTQYTYFASAGYCDPSVTKNWTCGANCNANPGFQPIASGGDGSIIQFCS